MHACEVLLSLPKKHVNGEKHYGTPPWKNFVDLPCILLVTLTINNKTTGNRCYFQSITSSTFDHARYIPTLGECSKTFKTFQALVKHFEKGHVNRRIPRRAVFFEDEKEVQLMAAQAIRSPAVQGEYKAWLTGVVERLNGIHHQRHKPKFTQVTTKVG